MTAPLGGVVEFVHYWRRVRDRTRRVAALVPPDDLEWSPRRGGFTPGDLIRHLAAIERWMYAETVHGRPSRYQGCGRDLADGLPACLAYLDRLHVESCELFEALGDDDLEHHVQTPAGTPIRTWKWLRAMIEHEAHHRGQLYLLLGLRGVPTPALYGLTSEELRDRSAQ